jgi:hypothetical protein
MQHQWPLQIMWTNQLRSRVSYALAPTQDRTQYL